MEVNIEKIMDDIRAEIRAKEYSADMISFSEVAEKPSQNAEGLNSNELICNLNKANAICLIPHNNPLTGNRIVVFIKRVIRKLIRFYVRPIVEQQNEFNAQTIRSLNEIGKYTMELNARPDSDNMAKKIEMLELKLETANKENEELRRRLARLEQAMTENSK